MATTTTPIQLPVIDISEATPEAGKAVIDAAIKYGFLYVDSASSEFSNKDVDSAFEMSREFFASPYEEKAQIKIGTNNRGWSGMHTETLDPEHQQRGDFKEAMNFGEFQNNKAQQPLPKSLIPHEAEIDHFTTLCRKTCDRILTLIALGLGIPSNWFTSRHDPSKGPSGCTFRFLYYPSIESPASSGFQHEKDIRAGAHSDYGSITLLFQRDGQPGLEILTHSGEWAPVPVRPNADNAVVCSTADGEARHGGSEGGFPPILVNIGDLFSYWTCGLLKSTVHRVVFPMEERKRQQQQGGEEEEGEGRGGGKCQNDTPSSRDRYSMAYFCHPVNDSKLIPVPSKLVEQHRQDVTNNPPVSSALGKSDGGLGGLGEKDVLTAREHLASRLAATYGGSVDDYK